MLESVEHAAIIVVVVVIVVVIIVVVVVVVVIVVVVVVVIVVVVVLFAGPICWMCLPPLAPVRPQIDAKFLAVRCSRSFVQLQAWEAHSVQK